MYLKRIPFGTGLKAIVPSGGLWPCAYAVKGSVIQRVFWGVTKEHAIARARRWFEAGN